MISAILSVIDRLLKLKEYRDQRLQRIYEQLFEPVFNDLLLVHRDYIQMFEKVHELLPSFGEMSTGEYIKELSQAIDYLREKRIEFEPVRVKLKVLMIELQGGSPFLLNENRKVTLGTEADSFTDAVLEYLESPQEGEDTVSHMLLYELVDSVNEVRGTRLAELGDEYILELPSDKGELFEANISLRTSVRDKVSKLRENWSRVCEAFAQLKVSVATRR